DHQSVSPNPADGGRTRHTWTASTPDPPAADPPPDPARPDQLSRPGTGAGRTDEPGIGYGSAPPGVFRADPAPGLSGSGTTGTRPQPGVVGNQRSPEPADQPA